VCEERNPSNASTHETRVRKPPTSPFISSCCLFRGFDSELTHVGKCFEAFRGGDRGDDVDERHDGVGRDLKKCGDLRGVQCVRGARREVSEIER